MFYPFSENKGADEFRSYCEGDLRLCFRMCKLFVSSCSGSNNYLLQTLHHVDHWSKTPGSEAAERAIVEAKRVLRPGGVLVIGEMLKSTIRESIWFMHLNEDLTARFSERFFTAEHILKMIEKAGFSCRTKLNVLGSDMFKNYWDPTGPLKDEWWKVSARGIYVMAKPEEIEAIKKFVQEKNDNGTMLEYMKQTDRTLERGSISFFISTVA